MRYLHPPPVPDGKEAHLPNELRLPAASDQDAAAALSALPIALSPGHLLVAFPAEALRLDAATLQLRSSAGEVAAPLSWHRLATALGHRLLLLARAQPALDPGARLELRDGASGEAIEMRVAAPRGLPALTTGLGPAALLDLLRFLAAKATGILRQGRAADRAQLAAGCHAAAAAVVAPAQAALPVALCGPDTLLWALPGGIAGAGGAHYLLGRDRLMRAEPVSGTLLLRRQEGEDGYLIAPGASGPIHLARLPARHRLPSLGALGRRREHAESLALHAAGLAALVRRAATEPVAARQWRDLQLLQPVTPPLRQDSPAQPVGGALEIGLWDHAEGLFCRGWLRDPLGLVAGLSLHAPQGILPLPPESLGRVARPDLAEGLAASPYGGAGTRPGFLAHLAGVARRPAAQWRLRVTLTTGDTITLVAPPAILHPAVARDAVLGAVAPAEITPELMDRCIAPAVAPLHRAVLALARPPEIVAIGGPRGAPPAASIIVPLYRNLRFLRHQYAAFARDPLLRAAAELIYVLDSPEQRGEVEHALRGLHGIHGLPVRLFVQSDNLGYASACNTGAGAARGGVLAMLNSDVVPAARGWLAPLLAALAADPRQVAAGPKLLFEDGSQQHAGLHFERGPQGEWFNTHYHKGFPRRFPAAQRQRPVPAVTGAALCVRREAFEAVGGFGTEYVIGDYEDSDLCLKLRAAGGEIVYVPKAELYHFERQSIRESASYARTLASVYNRRMHHRRWSAQIEALMAGPFARSAG